MTLNYEQGREGKGVIFVTSAGNGKKSSGDNCTYDWLVNFEYTISVAAVDADGKVPNYSERCSAVMVAAYSGSGTTSDLRIVNIILLYLLEAYAN